MYFSIAVVALSSISLIYFIIISNGNEGYRGNIIAASLFVTAGIVFGIYIRNIGVTYYLFNLSEDIGPNSKAMSKAKLERERTSQRTFIRAFAVVIIIVSNLLMFGSASIGYKRLAAYIATNGIEGSEALGGFIGVLAYRLFFLGIWVWAFILGLRLYSGEIASKGIPRYVVWTGFGFLIPLSLILSFVILELAVKLTFDKYYYFAHTWPKYVAAILSGVFIFVAYLLLKRSANYSNRIAIAGQADKFLLIPLVAWSAILPIGIGTFIAW